MRKVLILFVILLVVFNCKNKNSSFDIDIFKYKAICQVWGFLKYYHPCVGSGVIDWDKKLLSSLCRLDTIKNKKDLNILINELIFCCNDSINTKDIIQSKNNFYKEYDYYWLSNSNYISNDNLTLLNSLKNNNKPFLNHYVSQDTAVGNLYFDNEKPYYDSIFPSKNLRLLSLFRYWNIIYYFYPYLELNDISWEKILEKYISIAINIKDTVDYHLMILEFTSTLNDGHVWTESLPINLSTGIYSPPYKVKFIENTPIIDQHYPRSLGRNYNIQKGDQIIKINNTPVNDIIDSRKKYYAFANTNQHYRRIIEELLITPSTDSITLLLRRKNKNILETVKTYPLYELHELYDKTKKSFINHKIINDSILYLDLKYLNSSDIGKIITENIHLPKLIIDIRNYPKGVLYELSKYLNPSPTIFAKVFVPNIYSPGQFTWSCDLKAGIENKEYYKGRVILLVDENTQSHAEFTAMCLQSAPNVQTFGNITAGTDGNISSVYLPGDIRTYFTSIGIVYPDSVLTQRVGVKLDSIIIPTLEDYNKNYDRILDAAINF